MSPEERGKFLEQDTVSTNFEVLCLHLFLQLVLTFGDSFQDFGAAHEQSATEGQTAAPDRDEKVNLHFVAFVHHEGGLYELGTNTQSATSCRHYELVPIS